MPSGKSEGAHEQIQRPKSYLWVRIISLKLSNGIRLAMVAISINVTGQIYATYKKSDFCFNMKRNSKVVGGVTLLVSFTLRFVLILLKNMHSPCVSDWIQITMEQTWVCKCTLKPHLIARSTERNLYNQNLTFAP